MNALYAILLALFATLPALAQPYEAVIHLRSGTALSTSVEEVTSFGFFYQDGKGLFFRQVDSLWTREADLVEALTEQVPDAEVSASEGVYVVRLEGIDFPRNRARRQDGVVQEISITGAATGAERWGGDAAVRLAPRGLGPAYASLLSTIGWRPDQGTFKAGLGFGLGVHLGSSHSPLSFSAEAQVWQRFFQNDGERAEVSSSALNSKFNAVALALSTDWSVSDALGLWAGVRFYPVDLNARYTEFPAMGLLGVRYTAFRHARVPAQ